MILQEEGATQAQRDEAHTILAVLTEVYPGYPWAVHVYGDDTGGGVFIKNLDFDANYGMNLRHTKRSTAYYSASAFKRELIMKAGEFLERAQLKRGRSNEDPIKHVEGVPEKWQPPEYRAAKYLENVVLAEEARMREEARPQLQKEMANDGLVKAQ